MFMIKTNINNICQKCLAKKQNTKKIYKYFRLLFVKITNGFHTIFVSAREAWGNGGKNEKVINFN